MSAPELVAGYVIAGKYAIRSLLLHGGATASYRAAAAQNREVVVKLYDPAILSFPEVVKALAQHQSTGAKLPPQQIVPIAESGTDPNSGAPFTVTSFESAPSLAQLIDRGPLSTSDMLMLVRNLARTTDLLHSSGIASLSLHPANVFVRPGAQYQARVADFGASLVRTALPAPEKAGRWMPWLAPEQIKGQVPATHAADTFALALLAFFAVTGKPYWRSSQTKAPDTGALRREILGERMPASVRASEFSITLHPAVDAIFARALGFRPADRYATAGEFAAGLDAALSGPSVATADAARAPAQATGRMAPPPPRKMPLRTTMVGMGSAATAIVREASAKASAPAMEASIAPAPPVTLPPAMSPEPAPVAPRATMVRGGPPPLPMAPPPSQMEEVLARFEASPPERMPATAIAVPSAARSDFVQAPTASPAPEHVDASQEIVQTGVAVIGATVADLPQKSRLRWIASIGGLLILTAGAALALSGGAATGSGGSATRAAGTPPISSGAPGAPVKPQTDHAATGAGEARTGESLDRAAAQPLQQPEATEPAGRFLDGDTVAPPAPAPDESAPSSEARTGPAPQAMPSKNPCGKFLKRCK
jgi:hypothetical protein